MLRFSLSLKELKTLLSGNIVSALRGFYIALQRCPSAPLKFIAIIRDLAA
jgi:hypothetical protein